MSGLTTLWSGTPCRYCHRIASRVSAWRNPASVCGFCPAQYSRTGFQKASVNPASYPLPLWVMIAVTAPGSARASRQPIGAP